MNMKNAGIAAASMLFIALFPLPYGYYELLRWVVFAVALYFAWNLQKTKFIGWTVVYLGLALLFNPLIPVYLTKATWAPIDLIAGVLFLVPLTRKVKND